MRAKRLSENSGRSEDSGELKNSGLRDYCRIRWRTEDLIAAIAQSMGVTLLLSYFFYRSIWACIPLSAVGVLFFRKKKDLRIRKDRKELEAQFRECIESVSTALRAGYAVENAFTESMEDMRRLYGESAMITEELEMIRRGLQINIPLEELLTDLGARSGSEAIAQFAQVFGIAKRSGGNLPEIIRNSSDLIGHQIESEAEVETALSGKKMEQNIMNLMPFGILLYVGTTSPKYFDPMYGNLFGILVMTGLLAVYISGYLLGDRILRKLERI